MPPICSNILTKVSLHMTTKFRNYQLREWETNYWATRTGASASEHWGVVIALIELRATSSIHVTNHVWRLYTIKAMYLTSLSLRLQRFAERYCSRLRRKLVRVGYVADAEKTRRRSGPGFLGSQPLMAEGLPRARGSIPSRCHARL